MYFDLPPMMPLTKLHGGLLLLALEHLEQEYETYLQGCYISGNPEDVECLTSYAYLISQIEEIRSNIRGAFNPLSNVE